MESCRLYIVRPRSLNSFLNSLVRPMVAVVSRYLDHDDGIHCHYFSVEESRAGLRGNRKEQGP